jgi:hypothetical protein
MLADWLFPINRAWRGGGALFFITINFQTGTTAIFSFSNLLFPTYFALPAHYIIYRRITTTGQYTNKLFSLNNYNRIE